MTESQTEKLLRQMSLKKPSTELDARVAACFEAEAEVEPIVRSERVAWGITALIAAACLLIGVAVGHSTATGSVVDQAGGSSDSEDGRNVGPVTAHTVQHLSSEMFREQTAVPQVAVLCALGNRPTPDGDDVLCLNCHQGISRAWTHFPEEHIRRLRADSCAVCHTVTDSDKGADNGEEPASGNDDLSRAMHRCTDGQCLKCHQSPMYARSCYSAKHSGMLRSESCSSCHDVSGGDVPDDVRPKKDRRDEDDFVRGRSGVRRYCVIAGMF